MRYPCPNFYEITNSSLKTLCMLILNVIDNGSACDLWCLPSFDYDIAPILQEFYSLKRFVLAYLMYYIWYKAFIESYYFLCVKKTIEQIYQNMCLPIRNLIVMAYLSVQNVLLYNKRLSEAKL